MNRSARRAAILFAAYFVVLGLEALWLAVGPRWFQSAREWADMHPPYTPLWLLLPFIAGLTIAWAVDRGYRWAWMVAVVWMSTVSAGALALVGAMAGGDFLERFVFSHPVEAIMGAFQAPLSASSLLYLLRKKTRDWIFRAGPHAKPARPQPSL